MHCCIIRGGIIIINYASIINCLILNLNFFSYLMRVNYLGDCSFEIFDDPCTIALLKVVLLLLLLLLLLIMHP